jgi:hypothetical protein
MDITSIVLMIALGMFALAALTIVAYSLRNVVTGRHDWAKVGVMVVPFAIFGTAYGVMGTASEAGLATMVAMMGLLALLIAFSGLRRSFK